MDEYHTCTWSPYWEAELQAFKYFFAENCLVGSMFVQEDVIGWIPFEELDKIEVGEE